MSLISYSRISILTRGLRITAGRWWVGGCLSWEACKLRAHAKPRGSLWPLLPEWGKHFQTQLSIFAFCSVQFLSVDTWWGKSSCIRRYLLNYFYHSLEHHKSLEGEIALLSMCKDALSIPASRKNLQESRSLSKCMNAKNFQVASLR